MYYINENGELTITAENASKTPFNAVCERINNLATLCEHEPEFDYDDELGWLLMDYISDDEIALNVTDKNGEDIVAIRNGQVSNEEIIKAFDRYGYAYVGP